MWVMGEVERVTLIQMRMLLDGSCGDVGNVVM